MAESLFTAQTPTVTDASDGAPGITRGMAFTVSQAGTITNVRWWCPVNTGGTTTVALWKINSDGSGTLLASKVHAGTPTGGGWNLTALTSAIAVVPTETYRVGVHNSDGRYVATANGFAGTTITNGSLTGWADGTTGLPGVSGAVRNGTFFIDAALTYPTNFFNSANYFVDVVFEPAGSGVTPTGIAVPVATGAPATGIPAAAPTGMVVPVALGTLSVGPTAALPAVSPSGIAVPVALGSPTAGPTVISAYAPRTYTDAMGAMRDWINGRTATLVGPGNPLRHGAHLQKLPGGEPGTYAFLEEQFSTRSLDSGENPDMLAALSAQVYGGTRKAATNAAVALAEEISTQLEGIAVTVDGSVLMVSDDITGPSWAPDGDKPRLLVSFTVRARPA